MRLQLDTALSGADSTKSDAIGQPAAAGDSGSDSRRVGSSVSGAQDSIQISGPSSALNRMATDRAARIQQLTSAVQGGSYQVSSAKVGSAIVDHAASSHSVAG
jgi:anti-sigma28 factor (negative regulator of flagellin synthesis)